MSVSELFARLTLDLGLAPDYVLDRMEFYEVSALMEYAHMRHKEAWERARLIAYTTAQVQSSKKLKLSDICSFSWDKEEETASGDNTPMTQEELDATFAQMERMIAEGLI